MLFTEEETRKKKPDKEQRNSISPSIAGSMVFSEGHLLKKHEKALGPFNK